MARGTPPPPPAVPPCADVPPDLTLPPAEWADTAAARMGRRYFFSDVGCMRLPPPDSFEILMDSMQDTGFPCVAMRAGVEIRPKGPPPTTQMERFLLLATGGPCTEMAFCSPAFSFPRGLATASHYFESFFLARLRFVLAAETGPVEPFVLVVEVAPGACVAYTWYHTVPDSLFSRMHCDRIVALDAIFPDL